MIKILITCLLHFQLLASPFCFDAIRELVSFKIPEHQKIIIIKKSQNLYPYEEIRKEASGNTVPMPKKKPSFHFKSKEEALNFLVMRYGKTEGEEKYFLLNGLYQISKKIEFFDLAYDIGVSYRLRGFCSFVLSSKAHLKMSPWELRESYSKHIGTIPMYRGLRLSKKELNFILENGIKSRMDLGKRREELTKVFSNIPVSEVLKYKTEDRRTFNQIHHLIIDENDPQIIRHENNPFHSLTSSPALAAAVANSFGEASSIFKKRMVFIFKINVPIIDLLTKVQINPSRYKQNESILIRPNVIQSRAGFENQWITGSGGIESVYWGNIAPQMIEAVFPVSKEQIPRFGEERREALY